MTDYHAVPRYSSTMIRLHWLTFILVVLAYIFMEFREIYPRGSDGREFMKATHYSLGLTILGLTIARLVVKVTSGPAPAISPAPAPWQHTAAKARPHRDLRLPHRHAARRLGDPFGRRRPRPLLRPRNPGPSRPRQNPQRPTRRIARDRRHDRLLPARRPRAPVDHPPRRLQGHDTHPHDAEEGRVRDAAGASAFRSEADRPAGKQMAESDPKPKSRGRCQYQTAPNNKISPDPRTTCRTHICHPVADHRTN